MMSHLKQQIDPAMSEGGADFDQGSHANLDSVSVSQVSMSQYQESEAPKPTNHFAVQNFSGNQPLASSFGAGATIATNLPPGNSFSFSSGLKFSQGVQRPAGYQMPPAHPSTVHDDQASDSMTIISKSDANPNGKFRMGMGPAGDSLSGVGEGSRQPMGAPATSFSGAGGMDFQDMNNVANITMSNNDTKTSDNEAFMAYMSKAEAGDDDDDC